VESPAQIRRLRQLALERIAAHEKEVRIARREIALYDELLRLHGEANRSNIDSNMQLETAGKSRSTKISAGRSRIESASRTAAVALDLSDGDIAEITGASRQAVQKWHTGKMAIPKRHAAKLVSRGIPLDSWQRVAD
jgi:DNA-binding transcriptional regulator YiaG